MSLNVIEPHCRKAHEDWTPPVPLSTGFSDWST